MVIKSEVQGVPKILLDVCKEKLMGSQWMGGKGTTLWTRIGSKKW